MMWASVAHGIRSHLTWLLLIVFATSTQAEEALFTPSSRSLRAAGHGEQRAKDQSGLRWGYATSVTRPHDVPLALELAYALRQHGAMRQMIVLLAHGAAGTEERRWLDDMGCKILPLAPGSALAPIAALADPGTVPGMAMIAFITRGALVRGNMDVALPIVLQRAGEAAAIVADCAPMCASSTVRVHARTVIIRPSTRLHSELLSAADSSRRGAAERTGSNRSHPDVALASDGVLLAEWVRAHPERAALLPEELSFDIGGDPSVDRAWADIPAGIAHVRDQYAPWTTWRRWRWNGDASYAHSLIPIPADMLGTAAARSAFLEWRDTWNRYVASRPWRRTGAIEVLTYNTHGGKVVSSPLETMICAAADLRGERCPVVNLAGAHPGQNAPMYTRHITKVVALRDYLRAAHAAGRSNLTVIFADGSDVFFGGCRAAGGTGARDLLAGVRERLDALFALSGASIVFGAELGGLGEWSNLNAEPEVSGRGGRAPLPVRWQKRQPPWARQLCAQFAEAQASTPSDSAMAPSPSRNKMHRNMQWPYVLNSGLFAGQVSALLPMVERVAREMEAGMWYKHHEWLDKEPIPYVQDDQYAYSAYWGGHTDDVALDYCSLLVTNTFGMRRGGALTDFLGAGLPIGMHVTSSGRIESTDSKSSGRPSDVCFAHLSGGANKKINLPLLAHVLENRRARRSRAKSKTLGATLRRSDDDVRRTMMMLG